VTIFFKQSDDLLLLSDVVKTSFDLVLGVKTKVRPDDLLKLGQQSIPVNLVPAQRGVEFLKNSLGPIRAQPVALQALDNFALPLDALGAALDAFFGDRKLALDGGAIHSSAP